jgi:hypothetical protein
MDKPMDCGVTGCAAHRFIHRPEAAVMKETAAGRLSTALQYDRGGISYIGAINAGEIPYRCAGKPQL